MASMHCHPRKSTSIENPNHFWHLGSRIQMGDVWGQKHRFNVIHGMMLIVRHFGKWKNAKAQSVNPNPNNWEKNRRGNLWTWAVKISGGHYLWLVSGRKKFHKELFHRVVITFSQPLDFSSTKQLFPRGGNLMSFWWRAWSFCPMSVAGSLGLWPR